MFPLLRKVRDFLQTRQRLKLAQKQIELERRRFAEAMLSVADLVELLHEHYAEYQNPDLGYISAVRLLEREGWGDSRYMKALRETRMAV